MTICFGLIHRMQEQFFDYYDRNRTGKLISRLTADLFHIRNRNGWYKTALYRTGADTGVA